MNPKIPEACAYSIRNRTQLKNSKLAGCYYCLRIYDPTEIYAWVDDNTTALCPYCGMDSVLGDCSPYAITPEKLGELRKQWFQPSAADVFFPSDS
jgi:hypothetical protein